MLPAHMRRYLPEKLPGFAILLCLFVPTIHCAAGCAGARVSGDGEYRRTTASGIPLSLQFPEAMPDITKERAAEIDARPGKSLAERWMLARFHHINSPENDHLVKSVADYKAILVAGRGDGRALNNLACVYAEMEKYKDAEQLFQELLAGTDAPANAYYNLYILYRRSTRLDDGVRVLVMLKEKQPCSLYASIELGDIFFEKQDYTIAESYYRAVLGPCESNPYPIYKCAKALEAQGRHGEAEEMYTRCLAEFPYFHEAYLDYAHMLLVLERTEDAKKILNRAAGLIKK
ncbi:MAG: tetratricopeptide repeat protein [Spirochaetes bacterium]|nr:MAG: tetratricopeptide repeat protein [Spirochaetota bacterium]